MDTTLQQPIKETRRKGKRRRQEGDGSIVERHSAFHPRYWSVDAQGKRRTFDGNHSMLADEVQGLPSLI